MGCGSCEASLDSANLLSGAVGARAARSIFVPKNWLSIGPPGNVFPLDDPPPYPHEIPLSWRLSPDDHAEPFLAAVAGSGASGGCFRRTGPRARQDHHAEGVLRTQHRRRLFPADL